MKKTINQSQLERLHSVELYIYSWHLSADESYYYRYVDEDGAQVEERLTLKEYEDRYSVLEELYDECYGKVN